MKTICACMLALGGAAASAQTAAPADFPDGAAVPSAAELREHLGGRVFRVQTAAQGSWRLEYKANGYFFLNTNQGYADSGEWKAEDGRLCSSPRRSSAGCNDARMHGGSLWLRRLGGEVIHLVAD